MTSVAVQGGVRRRSHELAGLSVSVILLGSGISSNNDNKASDNGNDSEKGKGDENSAVGVSSVQGDIPCVMWLSAKCVALDLVTFFIGSILPIL